MPDFFGTGDPVALAEQRRNGRRDQSRAAKEAAAKAKAVDQHQEQEEAVKEEAVEDTEMQEDSISQTSQASPPASAKLAPGQPGKTDVTSSSPAVSQTQKKSSGSKRNQLTTTAKADIDHAAWEDFDYKSMMHGLKVEHFTVENCADVEKRYWRTLTFGEPPMYGADLEGKQRSFKTVGSMS